MNASTPAPSGDLRGVLDRLGLAPDRIVQELGYDDDVDHDFRAAVEERLGAPMEDDGYKGEIDAALLWWRGGDGDLTDALVDLVGLLDDGGYVALLTPRHTADAVEASEIEEAARTAGLHPGGPFNLSDDWRGVKLAPPRGSGRR